MKIALFIPNLTGGGAERVFLYLCEEFVAAGHSVDLVLMSATGAYIADVPETVRVVDLQCPRLWTSTFAFARYLRKERPDAVLAAMPLANGVAGWARTLSGVSTRVVLSEHNARSLTFGDVDVARYSLLQYPIRRAYRGADEIVACSAGVAAKLRELPKIDEARIRVVYNPAYTPHMEIRAADPVDHPWFEDGGAPVVLGVGRLSKQKDFGNLISAVHRLRQTDDVRLIILGEGEERASLERLIRQLEMEAHVDMPGFVHNPWAWMAKASVFALSSLHEGFSLVIIEAMACGTPVVSTDCPSGPSEILEGGRYGSLVPVADSASLAEGIARMLSSPPPLDMLKERARLFSKNAAAEGYLRILSGAN